MAIAMSSSRADSVLGLNIVKPPVLGPSPNSQKD